MKFFREPLVHFLIIGATLFAVYAFWGQQEWEHEKRQELNEQFVASVIARYNITIGGEPMADPAILLEPVQ